MQIERLVIEAGEHTFTLAFSERLTVVAGVGELEREGLVTELLAAMGRGRRGVHLQVSSDAGTRFTILRPHDGPPRVVEVDGSRDVTDAFVNPRDGAVDLLARAGFDLRSARRQLRIGSADMGVRARDDHRVAVLARLDQHRLWEVADKVRERAERLAAEAAEAGSTPEDAEIIGEIERRHRELEEAAQEHERARRVSFLLAANLTMLAVPMATLSSAASFVALAAGAATGGLSFRTWRRMEQARTREQVALEAAGTSSYLAFHLDRVNRLMSDDLRRDLLARASADHRAAVMEWRVLAGEIPVEWAWEHRSEIRKAAAERSAGSSPAQAPDGVGEVTAVMLARLARLRQLGPGGESFPAIFDEAFGDVPSAAKPTLLDRLLGASARQQVIVLTDDEDVTDWAREQAATGRVKLLEPTRRSEATSSPRRRAAGHMVA